MRARRRAVGLLELLENALQILIMQTWTGIGDGEADAVGGFGARARNAHQHAAAVGELDGVADEVEQHLPDLARIGGDQLRHVGFDMTAQPDILGEGARGEQFDDVVGDLAHRHRLRLRVEAPRLDLGVVEQILDQGKQRAGRGRDGADIGLLFRRQAGVGQQPGHAHDAVHRRANFMADGGEEARFGLAGIFGPLASGDQRGFGSFAGGDVARDGAMRNGAAVLVAHRQFDP